MNPNETAFPVENLVEFDSHGLTKRQLVAAIAMGGLIASNFYDRYNHLRKKKGRGHEYPPVKLAIDISYEYADELLSHSDPEAADVCQWKKEPMGLFETACNVKSSFNVGKFCPYCGKQIKEIK